jgi:hypothetical protein
MAHRLTKFISLSDFEGLKMKISINKKFALILLVCFISACAGTIRLRYLRLNASKGWGASEMVRAAESWAVEGRLGNIWSADSGASAHVSPIYPIILGSTLRIVGSKGQAAVYGQSFLTIFAVLLNICLLPCLAFRLGRSILAGVLASAFIAFVPLYLWLETSGTWEQPFTAVALALLLLSFAKNHRLEWNYWTPSIMNGILCGLSFLLSPSIAPSIGLLWLSEFVQFKKMNSCTKLTVSVLFACLVISPWVARNYLVMGKPILARSNFGLELWIGNNPEATATSYTVSVTFPNSPFMRFHPDCSEIEKQHLLEVGEVKYMDERYAMAREWILSHPRRFVELTLAKIRMFWLPTPDLWNQTTSLRTLKSALLILTGLGGLAGLFRLFVIKDSFRWLWAATLIGPSLIYAITHVDPRYRYPIIGISCLLTFDLLAALGDRIAAKVYPAAPSYIDESVVSAIASHRSGAVDPEVEASRSKLK